MQTKPSNLSPWQPGFDLLMDGSSYSDCCIRHRIGITCGAEENYCRETNYFVK